MTRKPKKSALSKMVVKKELIEIESDTDEVDARTLALCGEVNASRDDIIAKNPKKSDVAKTIVKKERSEIESGVDEEYGKMLALFAQVNASGDDTLSKSPNKASTAKTIVKEDIIEIESDTDEADGTILALSGEVNASGDDDLANNPKKSDVAKTIVKKDIIEIDSDIDEADGTILALCGEVNASGDDVLAKSLNKSVVAKTTVENELIEFESGTDEADGRMLALCGEVNASGDDAVAKTIVKNEYIEIELCIDEEYGKMLALCGEVNASGDDENPTNSAVTKSIVKNEIIEIESDSNTDEVDSQMLTLCGEVNASGDDGLTKNPKKSVVVKTVVKKEIIEIESDTDTDEAFGRMMSLCGAENARDMQIVCADDCSSVLVRDLDYLKYLANFSEHGNLFLLEDNVTDSPLRVMDKVDDKASDSGKAKAVKTEKRKAKSHTISSDSKRLKTENGRVDHKTKECYVKLKPTRNAMSQTVSGDSKRVKAEIKIEGHTSISKTIPVVNTKDTQRKKREEVPVTKHRSLHHSFKPPKKENEESLSSMDKCYTYYFASLRNCITISKSDPQVKPVKEDVRCLSDPDIIAVSNHPFFDGGKSPFEAAKDGKVIDLEDGITHGDIFNSSYSKKLMEILRKPYDITEFLKLYDEASLKRPLTRCRQLRDGKEIEYKVEDQLTLSYLEQYTDFNKKYCHYQKDRPRALNLLRGFFFYLENIVLEGAFKPWMHEKRLTNICFDARECKAIVR